MSLGIQSTYKTIIIIITVPATTQISTLSLHDALPICKRAALPSGGRATQLINLPVHRQLRYRGSLWCKTISGTRSEEHTSELQSHHDLVCRLLLEKKKKKDILHRNVKLRQVDILNSVA